MSDTKNMYDRLTNMMQTAGWQDDGWELEIETYDEKHFFFAEKNVRTKLLEATNHFPDFFIGRNSYAMDGGMFTAHTIIGRYCSISKDVFLGNSNHHMNCLSTQFAPKTDEFKAIQPDYTVIGCDVWIGANSVILQGRKIGHGAVIGAGSIITHDVPPYAVVAGNPGRILKYRFNDEVIKGLLETKWWTLPHEIVEKLPHDDVSMCIELIHDLRAR